MSTLLQTSLGEIQKMNPGEEFLVKDLFKGYEWKRFDLNERRNLGGSSVNQHKIPICKMAISFYWTKIMPINESTERNSM